jgi:hypothetical protein
MTATGLRFWVEVLPRFAVRPDPSSPSPAGGVPLLTQMAVAAGLDGAELDAELASVHRQRASLAAYELGLIERKATLGARQSLPFATGVRTDTRVGAAGGGASTGGGELDPAVAGGGGAEEVLDDPSLQAADDFLPDEVAVLLGMSVPSTRHHVDYALALVRQLPVVWRALADGRIDETRAKVIVKALGYQAVGFGGPVPADVVDALAACGVGWAERGCPPTTLRERLDAALIAADSAAADRRRELTKRGADVRVVPTGDGLADLRALHVDTAEAASARAQVDAYARALKADGDDRPIGQIRVSVLLSLIMRPWEARDPAVAHLTVDADLADLLLPDLAHLFPADDHDRAGDTDIAHLGTGNPGTADPDNADPDNADPDDPGTGSPDNGNPDNGNPDDDETDTAPYLRATRDGGLPPGRACATHPVITDRGTGLPSGGSRVGHVDGWPVSPDAVRELLRRIDALGLTHPVGGHLTLTVTGPDRRLLAVATPAELEAAAKAGRGIGPPPAAPGYTPTVAQYRYLRARDRHCRFPGCRQPALYTDADHVIPYDHRNPARGGQTCVGNLALLCRHHHRLKTHHTGWRFVLDPDGTLHVTTPGGTTRTTRPPAADEVLDLTADPPPPPHDLVADPAPF